MRVRVTFCMLTSYGSYYPVEYTYEDSTYEEAEKLSLERLKTEYTSLDVVDYRVEEVRRIVIPKYLTG